MRFDLEEAIGVLERTPRVLDAQLRGIPERWARGNEGEDSWSPFDIVGHLVHGERTDWMPRTRMILEQGAARAFEPFDRFAQFEASRGKSLEDLLEEFAGLRAANLETLRGLRLGDDDMVRTGRHPDFGVVTLEQLLATWVVHDLGHIGQIVRVLSKQYMEAVGPWRVYLPVLDRGPSSAAKS